VTIIAKPALLLNR